MGEGQRVENGGPQVSHPPTGNTIIAMVLKGAAGGPGSGGRGEEDSQL